HRFSTTTQDKAFSPTNYRPSTTTRTWGANKIGFLFALLFVISIFMVTPLIVLACHPGKSNGGRINNSRNDHDHDKDDRSSSKKVNNNNSDPDHDGDNDKSSNGDNDGDKDGDNDNNNSNGILLKSCTLVDTNSGSTKLELSGGLNPGT